MRRFNIYHRKDGRWEGRMPISRGIPVRSTSTTNCSMNLLKTEEACFKAYLRYLLTIRKCVTIWQGDYAEQICSLLHADETGVCEPFEADGIKVLRR